MNSYLEAAIKTKSEYVPDRGTCYSFYNIGNEFRLLNKPDSALKYYGMAENIAHKHHFLDLQQTIYKKTSETYREMGDSILEMNYRNKFIFNNPKSPEGIGCPAMAHDKRIGSQ